MTPKLKTSDGGPTGLARKLLGRHVRHRPDHGAGLSLHGHGGGGRILPHRFEVFVVPVGQFGQPEIEDLDLAVGGDHHVGRFEVAMDDALGVGRRQGRCDGNGDRQQLVGGKPRCRDSIVETLAVHQFHGEVTNAAVLTDGVDCFA